ncbi:MAG: malto-oligosyltrehalose trehalohydrolase [Elusimicrobia bacterium]|nr:malto-oligosyltrehalose trehalohydrolase [Elusimicrobiota bacterium]
MIPVPAQPIVAFPRRGPWALSLGARVEAGGVRLRVWAPRARSVAARLGDGGELALARGEAGEWSGFLPGGAAGLRYAFSIDGGAPRADPSSRFQPGGVHGFSEAVDPAFPWTDRGWRGVALRDAVIYEAHVGAFTPEGTYAAMAARLPHLRRLGVTVLELLPLGQCPGRRNWGYDGAYLYAPHAAYGRPEDLRRLVNECHRLGIAVCLDVVYNHIGPEGNYLGEFGPYFADRYRTPWGPAMNYDWRGSDGVRRWAIENALYWMTEFHIDAFRLDAVNFIYDFSPFHVLAELKAAVAEQARRLGRRAWIVAESDSHDSRMIRPLAEGGWGLDAQWADDFHHGLHALVTGDRGGYFGDYRGLEDVARALEEGYAFDGRYSPYKQRRHGSPAADLPAERFVFCIQNHDQVGNRPEGERLAALAGLEAQKACAALLLAAPQTPMLFMGEEWGERRCFLYFTDHQDPGLAEAVRRGRRAEMRRFDWRAEPADPQSARTLARSRLDWSLARRKPHAGVLALYRELGRLRASCPALKGGGLRPRVLHGARWLAFERRGPGGARAALFANLGEQPVDAGTPFPGPWRRVLSTRERRFGGPGGPLGGAGGLLPPMSASLFLRPSAAIR